MKSRNSVLQAMAFTSKVCGAAFVCGMLFLANTSLSAQNLVPNPSFELFDECPTTFGFLEEGRPTDWYRWDGASPDYFNGCVDAPRDTIQGVPWNSLAFQYAQDGVAYVGLYTYFPPYDYREYIGTQLTQPMMTGEEYHVSFRANLVYGGSEIPFDDAASNNLGVLFTMDDNAFLGPIGSSGPTFAFRDYAHVHSEEVITDTAGWTLVSGNFIPDSAYQYIVLGNFFRDSLTTGIPGLNGFSTTYYLIDSVNVVCLTPGCGFSAIDEDSKVEFHVSYDMLSGAILIRCDQIAEYRVFDALGCMVSNGITSGGTGYIPSQDWPIGMYLVRAINGQSSDTYKVVVQH